MIIHGLVIHPSFDTERLEYILSNLTFLSKYACYAIQNITIGITDDPVETMQNFRHCLAEINSLKQYQAFEKSGFHVFIRDDRVSILPVRCVMASIYSISSLMGAFRKSYTYMIRLNCHLRNQASCLGVDAE